MMVQTKKRSQVYIFCEKKFSKIHAFYILEKIKLNQMRSIRFKGSQKKESVVVNHSRVITKKDKS